MYIYNIYIYIHRQHSPNSRGDWGLSKKRLPYSSLHPSFRTSHCFGEKNVLTHKIWGRLFSDSISYSPWSRIHLEPCWLQVESWISGEAFPGVDDLTGRLAHVFSTHEPYGHRMTGSSSKMEEKHRRNRSQRRQNLDELRLRPPFVHWKCYFYQCSHGIWRVWRTTITIMVTSMSPQGEWRCSEELCDTPGFWWWFMQSTVIWFIYCLSFDYPSRPITYSLVCHGTSANLKMWNHRTTWVMASSANS